jgi:hypothetical protein
MRGRRRMKPPITDTVSWINKLATNKKPTQQEGKENRKTCLHKDHSYQKTKQSQAFLQLLLHR